MSLRVFSAPASQSSGVRHARMVQSPRMCAGLTCGSIGSRAAGRSSGRAAFVAKKTHALNATSAAPLRVTCMANQRRVAKVQQQMRREISNMMQTDKVSPPHGWCRRLFRQWHASSQTNPKTYALVPHRPEPNRTKPSL